MKYVKSKDIYTRHCAYLILIGERNSFDGSIALDEALKDETDERMEDYVKRKTR